MDTKVVDLNIFNNVNFGYLNEVFISFLWSKEVIEFVKVTRLIYPSITNKELKYFTSLLTTPNRLCHLMGILLMLFSKNH